MPSIAVCMKHKIGTPLHKDLIPNAPTIVRLYVTGIILFWNGWSWAFIFHRLAFLNARMLMLISNSLPWVKLDWKSTNKLFTLPATLLGCVWGRIPLDPHLLTYLLYFSWKRFPTGKTSKWKIEALQTNWGRILSPPRQQVIPQTSIHTPLKAQWL